MFHSIITSNLIKRYGSRRALDGFSLSVPRDTVMGMVGPNGAGKTTWMMSVAGLLHSQSGEINLLGLGAFDSTVHSGRIAILPQDSALPTESRPLELLVHYGLLQGLSHREAAISAARMLNEARLGDRLHSPIRTLSHGMRKRVMIAQCFIGQPEVVLLDEPLSGLDPRESANMRGFINRRRGKHTIVVSSHNLRDIENMCDYLAFVEKGRAVRVAPLAEIVGRQGVLIYHLDQRPTAFKALKAALPEAGLEYVQERSELICNYEADRLSTADVNRRLLPLLLECGVNSVSCGNDLEQAYLEQMREEE